MSIAKKTTLVTLVLACAWLPSQTSAALCHSFSEFGRDLKHCEDNLALSESAMNCVDDYERSVEAGKARIQKLMAAQVAKMKSRQNDSFDRSSASYQQVQQELNRLISEGEAAKSAVDSYNPELFLPEDYDQPKVIGMSTEDYLNSEPCYATPHAIVTGSSELLAKMLADLRKTDLAALGKQGQSSDRSGKVQDMGPRQAPLQGGQAAGKAPTKSGQSKDRDSQVTGVIESMQKEQKARH